jgi:hypothetical protein
MRPAIRSSLGSILPDWAKVFIKRVLSKGLTSNPVDHRAGMENVLRHYSRQLAGKRVIVFYVSGHGRNQIGEMDWVGQSSYGDLTVEFTNLSLEATDFYQIDDHLNLQGHKSIALQLYEML